MPSVVPRITYPDGPLMWRRDIKVGERLEIINPDDFPLGEMIDVLGLKSSSLFSSFGISNEAEIAERHALTRILLKNEAFRRWPESAKIPFDLPTEGQKFLNFNDPERGHNPYWETVHRFLEMVDALPERSPRLSAAAHKLREGIPLEVLERIMAELITREVEKATVLAGTMTFVIQMNQADFSVYDPETEQQRHVSQEPRVTNLIPQQVHLFGHRRFSQGLSDVRLRSYPLWTEEFWHIGTFTGVSWLAKRWVDWANGQIRNRAYKAMVVAGKSESAVNDVKRSAILRLNKLEWSNRDINNGEVVVAFQYSSDTGLDVRIIDVRKPQSSIETEMSSGLSTIAQFGGMNADQRKQIEAARQHINRLTGEVTASVKTHEFRAQLQELSPGILGELFKSDCPSMDHEFKWSAISNLYESDEWRELTRALRAHRRFFCEIVRELMPVAEVVEMMVKKARELKVPICSPRVESNSHVIGFNNLIPIHLLRRDDVKKVVPVTELPELNGNMIGLTGRHGGGKTETEIAVALISWLAHSGLPVFSEDFWFNPKRVLGLALVPRRGTAGSTCEMMITKYKGILEAIRRVDGRHVVLFLDEIGLGTQEQSGLELGRDLLATLARRKVSVLFSTQITSLAEQAERDLGAVCFKVDDDHRITRGIGDGGMNELRKRSGLNKLISVN